jgi:hypothetical protein
LGLILYLYVYLCLCLCLCLFLCCFLRRGGTHGRFDVFLCLRCFHHPEQPTLRQQNSSLNSMMASFG